MTKAKTRTEFVSAWSSEFDVMASLVQSLPSKDALEYLGKLKDLRAYIEKAANNTYGDEKRIAETARRCRKYATSLPYSPEIEKKVAEEHDQTDDLPAHEEGRHDYRPERGEPTD
jgi:hypothetical protein